MTPAPWLIRLGLDYHVRLSLKHVYGEWKKVLRVFHIVPNDSLEFAFCRKGNVKALRTIGERRDLTSLMDEEGQTLLDVSRSPGF